jgi:carboxyl-terminal processing protease
MKKILNFMKRNYKALLVVAALSAVLWSFVPNTFKGTTNEKDKVLLDLLSFVLDKGHYSPINFNDDMSKKAYDAYLKSIDPTKRFFLQSDIDEFKKYENQIDDIMQTKDLTFFDLTYNRLLKRIAESEKLYGTILQKPINLNSDRIFNVDYEKVPYSQNKKEWEARWTDQLLLNIVASLEDKEKIEQDKKEKDPNYKAKAIDVLEKEVRNDTKNNLDNSFTYINELKREDWFATFLNAIVAQYDPHTFYFSPEGKDKFDTVMSGKFEGIGARLQKKNDAIEVSELISGGPAWRGKELEAGDVIMKVAQEEEEFVDVTSMRLEDAIKKIKGPKGTTVRLYVKKADGTFKTIRITRDEVETEETFAKSTVVTKNNKLFGVIYLPKFYISFENRDNRDAFKDVAHEIERLKALNIEGLIVDLRDNGGGSLETVVKMTGLFIDKGPVVQVKAAGRNAEILPDRDPSVQWDGPLVVMVNNFSASASEIFAAAIQDYNRGIIIGSTQTFGKGTVQNLYELNQFVKNDNLGDLGALKTTTQKFYRINGGSTQLQGVKSDIVLPDRYRFVNTGERDENNAMPWDKIASADYKTFPYNFESVKDKSKTRIRANSYFRTTDEYAQWFKIRNEDNEYHLNYQKFKDDSKALKESVKRFEILEDYNNNLSFSSLPYEVEIMQTDNLLKEKRERWHQEMAKDAYLEEGLNVLYDLTSVHTKTTAAVTKTKKSKLDKLNEN